MSKEIINISLANPRGFCAGVERAILIVEKTLEKYGAPIYVHHEVVHNKYVIKELNKKGVIFVAIGLVLYVITFVDVFALVVALPFWAWVLYDAYKNVKLYNKFVEENGKKPEW